MANHKRTTCRRRRGGRGGDMGHAYTTGASQELSQMTGRTPGLSSGGGAGKSTRKRQQALRMKQARALAKKANTLETRANVLENRANALENKAEKMKNKAEHLLRSTLRANAPTFVPKHLRHNTTAKYNLIAALKNNVNNNNNHKNDNNVLNRNFDNIMREVHTARHSVLN